MTPVIKILPSKKLIGMRIKTSLSDYQVPQLWQQFMPRVKEIKDKISTEKYSIQIYSEQFSYSDFNPEIVFTYWAATEVADLVLVPEGMETLELRGGKYAVFTHKGPMSTFQDTMNYIHQRWFPKSQYQLDHRPHFEILDERYLGPQNPESEEEVWVPVK